MPQPSAIPDTDALTRLITYKLRRLRYGVIQLTVHDGRVVQIDCTERTRLPADPAPGPYPHNLNP